MTNDEIKAALAIEYALLSDAEQMVAKILRNIREIKYFCKHTDIIPTGFTAGGRIRVGQCRTCSKTVETEV
jgi:hypothetical protein